MTLTEFLLARIAEDEAVAEKARALQDHFEDRWWVDGPAEVSRKWWVYATGEKFNHEATATHIARHDPARVLAECDAKRRIVELHKSWPVLIETPPTIERVDSTDPSQFAMRASQQIAWTTEQKYREQFGAEPPTGPILRALALPYADHDDYLPEWRP